MPSKLSVRPGAPPSRMVKPSSTEPVVPSTVTTCQLLKSNPSSGSSSMSPESTVLLVAGSGLRSLRAVSVPLKPPKTATPLGIWKLAVTSSSVAVGPWSGL